MPEVEEDLVQQQKQDNHEKQLNYHNNATKVHPLIVQLYRCELDEEDGDRKNPTTKNSGDDGEKEGREQREKSPPDPIYRASEHNQEFDPDKYLEGFYKSAREDTAMQIVLFFLPGMICRLPRTIKTMLDLGAGPTIYIPVAVRHYVQSIFTSDYSPVNRKRLVEWVQEEKHFDWTQICLWIAELEASHQTPEQMQKMARDKVRAILAVDVQKRPVIQGEEWRAENFVEEVPEQFDLVATVFCMEYSCETLDGYHRAIQGACSLIRPGGWLLMGGIFHATEYRFGGKRFSSHFLTKEHVFSALQLNGMYTEKGTSHNQFHFITHDDIFLLLSKKKASLQIQKPTTTCS